MTLNFFIVDGNRLLTADDLAIFSVAEEEIVQHLSVRILSHLVLFYQEQSRLTDSLWRRQEFAFVFDIFSVLEAWAAGLLVINSRHHLVKVERYR